MAERIALVQAAVAEIGRTTDRMAVELAHQMGRPVRYGGEFGGFEERASHMAGIAAEALAPIVIEDSDRFRRLIAREPLGVVLVIAPWNYPYMTAINTIAPALIAGNTVMLKHATQTLQVGERLGEAFLAAGIPEEVFRNVVLDHEATEALISGRHVDFVNFTGSVAGGQAMERAAAGTFIPVSTELGGKDPGYVRADADLEKAVDTLMDGAMYNAGQCCCGIERIYVHESLYDAFVEKAVAWVNAQKLGNPLDGETTLGPMANVRFAREVRAQIEEALADGAVDMAIGSFPRLPATLIQRRLFDRHYVALVSREHRLAGQRLSLRRFAETPQLVVHGNSGVQDVISELLAAQQLQRQDLLELPSYLMVPPLLAQGEFLAVVPGQLAEVFNAHGTLAVLPLPFRLPPSTVRIYWHRRFNDDAGLQWLRGVLVEELAQGGLG